MLKRGGSARYFDWYHNKIITSDKDVSERCRILQSAKVLAYARAGKALSAEGVGLLVSEYRLQKYMLQKS